MENQINQSVLDAAEAALRKIWPDAAPRCGLVLGSGWDEVVADLSGETIDYADIPGLGATGVLGHAGKLRRASVDGMELFIFQGRRHWYEGVGWTPIILPAYLLHAFGADTLLLTNAAGGISSALPPGTIMVIEDHINMLGSNPLIGPHNPRLGLRFPDQSAVYDKALRHQLMNAGADAAGIYLATTGHSPLALIQAMMLGWEEVEAHDTHVKTPGAPPGRPEALRPAQEASHGS